MSESSRPMANHFQSLLYPGSNPCKKRNSVEFDDLYNMFLTYKTIHGHLRVPQKYVVPNGDDRFASTFWGFKLGCQLNAIYTTAVWTKDGHKQRLIELGILPAEDQNYGHLCVGDVVSALQCYQQLYGDVNTMPTQFHIPLDENLFPATVRGCALGEVLESIRTRRLFFNYENLKRWRELKIEFYSELNDYQFSLLRDAIVAFKLNHDTAVIPNGYIIPSQDARFPQHIWGYKLGSQAHNIRSQGTWVRGTYQRQLTELGVLPPPVDCVHSAGDILACLKLYAEHVDKDVGNMAKDFCIPIDQPNEFPLHFRGVVLGEIVESIRKRELYFDSTNARIWRSLGITFERKKTVIIRNVVQEDLSGEDAGHRRKRRRTPAAVNENTSSNSEVER